MHYIRCSEIWGGIRDHDADVQTSGVVASLYSGACDGGRGGDVYYVSVCSSDLLTRVAIADVMGHGEAVSRISGWLYDALAERMNSLDGHEVLRHLNRRAEAHGYRATTTGLVFSVYLTDGGLYFSYAGHPPILRRDRVTGEWEPLELPARPGLRNLPLGVEPETLFDQERVQVESGDRLFVYTDGVLEAPDSEGRLFGVQRLRSALRDVGEGHLPDLKRSVLERLRRHTGGPLSHDDVTLIAIEVR